jgi:hypothetical protein
MQFRNFFWVVRFSTERTHERRRDGAVALARIEQSPTDNGSAEFGVGGGATDLFNGD